MKPAENPLFAALQALFMPTDVNSVLQGCGQQPLSYTHIVPTPHVARQPPPWRLPSPLQSVLERDSAPAAADVAQVPPLIGGQSLWQLRHCWQLLQPWKP